MGMSWEAIAAVGGTLLAAISGAAAALSYAHKEGVRQGLLGHRVDTLEKTVDRHEQILTVRVPQ